MEVGQHRGCCKVTQRGRQGPALFSLSALHPQQGDIPLVVTKRLQPAAPGVSSHSCAQKGKKVSLLLMAEENGFRPPSKSVLTPH